MKKEYSITCYDDDSTEAIECAIHAEQMLASLRDITLNLRKAMEYYEVGHPDLMFSDEQMEFVMTAINCRIPTEVEGLL